MKKLLFGLIATVMFGFVGNAQSFDTYGQEHNRMLENILPKLSKDVVASNVFEEVKNIIATNISATEANNLYKFSNYTSPYLMLDELISRKIISTELSTIVKTDLDNTCASTDFKTIGVYVSKAITLSNRLSSSDKIKYSNFLSTLKHSSYFWDANGGNGTVLIPCFPTYNPSQYVKRGPAYNDEVSAVKINWWKVLACDGVGALVGNAPGAAGASACSAIGQL
jgi:hypothetical protein